MKSLAALLVLAWALPAQANPIDMYGFGSRVIALGGAGTAITDGAAANYYNPGALARGRDLRIDIGYRYAQPLLRLNGRDVGVDAASGFEVGLVAPGAIGGFHFAFGAAMWLPDERVTRARELPYAQPRFVDYDNRAQRILLSANLAVQIVPGLYVGGGLTFMSRTQGELYLSGNLALANADASALQSKIDVDLVAVRYPQAGIRWDPTRYLSLGLTYRHSFALRLDQQFRLDGSIGNPGSPPVVANGHFAARSISDDLFQPWQLAAGASLRLTRRLLVTFDATYARWSDFPVAASQLTLDVDVGTFNSQVHLPPARVYPPPGFHDILIPRLGVEWRARERPRYAIDLRGGYGYEPTPAPEQIGESNLADADNHTFSTGIGFELRHLGPILPRPLSIDVHLAVTWLPDRANRKVDPTDPVGDFVAGGVVVQTGLMLRSRF